MDLNTILTFMAVATLLVVSPGPNGFLIAKTVPLSGHKAGLANVIGFIGAFYIHGTLSIFGISILLVNSSVAFSIFKMLGAAYLVWVGLKAIRNAIQHGKVSTKESLQYSEQPVLIKHAFTEGFLTNMLNPKVSMFYLAAFPQFVSADSSILNAYALVSAHSIVNFMWFSAMVFTLSKVKNVTSSPKFKVWLNYITGVVFIGFGIKLVFSKSS